MATCSNNINPLYNNYFSIVFGRGTTQFELLCQRVNLPGLAIPMLTQPTTLGTTIPVPSLSVGFDDLIAEFIVDSNLKNWKTIYSWIRNISNIKDDQYYNIDYKDWHITATLNIFSEPYRLNGCNSHLAVNFTNIIPVSLSGLQFQSDNTDSVILKASAKFKYSYYTLNPDADINLS